MRLRCLPTVVLLSCGLAACTATVPRPVSPVPITAGAVATHVRDELYFGMRRPDGTLVAEAEWQAFVDSVVTPRFPAGLTVLAGYGQWRPETGPPVREPSKVLILIHQGGPDAERRIREIAAIYCLRFQQESVMRVTDRVSAEFLGAVADP